MINMANVILSYKRGAISLETLIDLAISCGMDVHIHSDKSISIGGTTI